MHDDIGEAEGITSEISASSSVTLPPSSFTTQACEGAMKSDRSPSLMAPLKLLMRSGKSVHTTMLSKLMQIKRGLARACTEIYVYAKVTISNTCTCCVWYASSLPFANEMQTFTNSKTDQRHLTHKRLKFAPMDDLRGAYEVNVRNDCAGCNVITCLYFCKRPVCV